MAVNKPKGPGVTFQGPVRAQRGFEFPDDDKASSFTAMDTAELLSTRLRSKHTLVDDFDGNALDDNGWNGRSGSNGNASDPAINADIGGVVRLTTGDSSTTTMAANGSQLERQLCWQADQGGLVFEAMVNISANSDVALFVGFTDQVSSLEMPINASGSDDDVTSNASDAVGFLFDTDFDTLDSHWLGIGVADDTDAGPKDTEQDVDASTDYRLRIEVDDEGAATFYIDGEEVASLDDAVSKDTPLTPVVAGFSRTDSTRNIDVDYIYVQQDR